MSAAKKWDKFKPLPSDIQSKLKSLPEFFGNTEVLLVYLFGSLAENDKGNDVDLAILTDNTPPYSLRDQIASHLGTERIDIVDLHQATPAFCFEIIRAGHLLYAVDEDMRLQFELGVVRRYHDTAYLRERQEKGLKERMVAWSSSTAVS